MAEILIVRHAEPVVRGVFLGASDPGLSETGIAQAKELMISEAYPIYCSPLRRARETADALGRPYQVLEGLREIDYGPWEGMSWTEIEQKFPDEAAQKMADWRGYCVEGAESWSAFEERVLGAFAQCLRPAIVVAHVGVNSVIHERITGSPAMEFRQAYCEILRLSL
jgi:broad specificity phosphatase PhoE